MNAPGTNRALWLVLLALLVAVTGVLVYRLQPLLNPRALVTAPSDPGCDLRAAACSAHFPGGGALRFEVEPKGIPAMAPLVLRLWLRGIQADTVQVDFTGVDMKMGYNRPALRRVGDDRFEGQGTLPNCLHGPMTWEARVLIRGPRGLLAARFQFQTSRDH